MLKNKCLIITAALFLGLTAGTGWSMEPMLKQENPLVGSKAPDFTLSDVNGQRATLQQIRGGKNTILFFWATWCPHCRTQTKEIQANQAQFKAKNVEMVFIDAGERKEEVVEYLTRMGISLPSYLDEDGQVSDKYKIFGLPTFVFIDQQGTITAVEHHLPENYADYFVAK